MVGQEIFDCFPEKWSYLIIKKTLTKINVAIA